MTLLVAMVTIQMQAQNMYGNVGSPDNSQPFIEGANMVSVDMYTGTGSVDVPIYDYSLGGLNLGVSFSYNAKGVKVDQKASSIGLGWSLNAGGSITRQVKGIEDEVTTPAIFSSSGKNMTGCVVPGANFNNYYSHSQNTEVDDQEHDLFYLDLCGRHLTLQFYLDSNENLQYITYPKSEIKLELVTRNMVNYYNYDTLTYASSFTHSSPGTTTIFHGTGVDDLDTVLTFNITDEKGNKFYFERGNFLIKEFKYYNVALSLDSGIYYPTTKWVLRKVETASGFAVNYDYKTKYLEYIDNRSEMLDLGVQYQADSNAGTWELYSTPLTVKENMRRERITHLYRISYPNGVEIKFNLRSDGALSGDLPVNVSRCDCFGDYLLDSIEVISNFGNDLSNTITYHLDQKYFNTPKYGITETEVSPDSACQLSVGTWTFPSYLVSDQISYLNADQLKSRHYQRGFRLKFKELNRTFRYSYAATADTELMYRFTYNPIPLPYRLGSQKDYYGYYNGNSTIPVPIANINYLNGDTVYHREFDTAYLSIPDTIRFASGLNKPLHVFDDSLYYGTRKSHNPDSMAACILTNIENGARGEVEIVYKGDYTLSNPAKQYYHHFYYPSGDSISHEIDTLLEGQDVNDGLIVEKIIETNYTSQEHIRTTEYVYSGGERFNRGGYSWYPTITGGTDEHIVASFFVTPHEYIRGSNHGFTYVEKNQYGYNNELLGKQKYTFTNLTLDAAPYTNMRKRTGDYFHTLPGELQKYRMGLPTVVQQYSINTNNNSISYLKNEIISEYETVDETPTNVFPGNYKIGLVSKAHFQGPTSSTNICGGEYWNSGVVYESYYPLNYQLTRLKSRKDRQYFYDTATSSNLKIESISTFTYDEYHNLVEEISADSKGDTFKKETWYNYRYTTWSYALPNIPISTGVTDLTNNGLQYPLSTAVWKLNNGANDKLLSFSCVTTSGTYGGLKFAASFNSKQNELLDYDDIFPSASSIYYPSNYIKRSAATRFFDDTSETDFGSNLVLSSYAKYYDNGHNPIEVWNNDRKNVSSYIYQPELSQKLAEAANAEYRDIAFTSFEDGNGYRGLDTAQYNKGNWDFIPSAVVDDTYLPNNKAMTGWYAYLLEYACSSCQPTFIKSRTLQDKDYLLSFWAAEAGTNSGPPEVILWDSVNATSPGNATLIEQNTVGDWKLYTAVIDAEYGYSFTIQGIENDPGFYIDEIRLHPVDAVMTTYTQEPLTGVRSTNNTSNYIIYTEYDDQGRYFRTRDMRGYIIEQIETKFNDLDGGSGQSGSSGS